MTKPVKDYIKRNGPQFPCGHRVALTAYVTVAFNNTTSGKPSWRVRCLKHHRINAAEAMRRRRAER